MNNLRQRTGLLATVLVSLTAANPRHEILAQVSERNAPPHRLHHALTYDHATRRVLMYGGMQADSGQAPRILADLWSWDGHRWATIAQSTGIALVGHSLWADGEGGVFMRGGARGLTGRWNGNTWSVVTEDSTWRRGGAAIAFDSRRKRLVLFGGSINPRVRASDTWEFDGHRWMRVDTAGPPRMLGGSMVYDERRGVAVLFGGADAGRYYGDTWTWDGSRWERLAVSGPSPRSSAGMAYDSRRGEAVLFGGADSSGRQLDETWLWNGEAWRRANVPGPSARRESFMVFDSARGVAVLFGGSDGWRSLGDTWEWDGVQWRIK